MLSERKGQSDNRTVPRRRLMLLVALVCLCAMQAGCGSTSATHAKVYVPQAVGSPLYKSYATTGQNVDFGVTRWLSYGGASAKAIATTYVNTCARSCAGGPWVHARMTIVFSGRVPCDGVSAYATYRVLRTSNPAAARVGDTADLWSFCGYPAFTPSLPCLSRHSRAASMAAQARCYVAANRAASTHIAKTERSLSTFLYDAAEGQSSFDHQNLAGVHPERAYRLELRVARTTQATFTAGERGWRAYRQDFCSANFGPSVDPPNILYDACLFRLDEAHLRDLTTYYGDI